MKKIRILMTADTLGGIWTYALELARILHPHGVEVTLATMGAPASDGQRAEAAARGNVALHESCYRLEWMEEPWQDVEQAGRWLLDLRTKVQPDLIHLNGYAHGALNWQAPCVVAAHSCVLSWWRAVRGEAAPASWDRYRHVVAHGMADASAIVAPTNVMLDSIRENHRAAAPGRVISNSANPLLFKPGRKQPFVLTVGRWWDEAKNLKALEVAVDALPWPTVAAGEVPVRETGAIRYLGKLSSAALARHFAAASIYALPARYEPFGLSILEAAMSACALVIGDIPSLRELWEGAALFVNPDDQAGLRAALRRLITSRSEREDYSNRALERSRKFSPARMADSYLELYGQLLGRHAQAGATAV